MKDKTGGSLPGMDDPSPNSRIRKLAFAFRMYDLNGDGSISKDEILAVLLMMVGDEVPDEQLQCIAERAILEVRVVAYFIRNPLSSLIDQKLPPIF